MSRIILLLFAVLFMQMASIAEARVRSTDMPASQRYPIDGIQDAAAKLSQTLVIQLQQTEAKPLAITSLVNADTLQPPLAGDSHARIGQQLSEALFTELKMRDVQLIDVRGRTYIEITEHAELNLSRDIHELNEAVHAEWVVVTTLAPRQQGVMLHSRVVQLSDQQVLASASQFLAKRLYWQQRQVESVDGVLERETALGGQR